MSSNYQLICVSHSPALLAGEEYPNTSDLAWAERALVDGIEDHLHCTLVLGRWSGGLIEIGTKRGPHSVRWTDVEWLRLLRYAGLDNRDAPKVATLEGHILRQLGLSLNQLAALDSILGIE